MSIIKIFQFIFTPILVRSLSVVGKSIETCEIKVFKNSKFSQTIKNNIISFLLSHTF